MVVLVLWLCCADRAEPKKKREGEEKPKRAAKPQSLSPALAEFLGESELPRTEVSRRINAYVREHNLQDPKDGRVIVFDEKLQNVFKTKKTTWFKINQLISKHVKSFSQIS
jgi:upstream activation factor subunit UAF30